MLFQEKYLQSNFDFDCELSDELATLNYLCKEIQLITKAILLLVENDEIVNLRYKDNNGNLLFVDKNKINDKTWYRDISEIRNILYRKDVEGKEKQQFSINKALKSLGIYEPKDKENYKQYLKILYFFYMMNYFVFPDKNIFKLLSDSNLNYLNSYDQGSDEGKYLNFIIDNVLSNEDELNKFIKIDRKISIMMDEISLFYKTENNCEIANLEEIRKIIENEIGENPLSKLWFFCYKYNIKAYCKDILQNIKSSEETFIFDPLEIGPFVEWKNRYINIDEIEDFLREDKFYWFVKQKISKVESRDKIKLIESNAVKNLKSLVDYDLQWMEDFNTDKGLILEKKDDGEIYIYALRMAVVVKSYYDLVNKVKLKIKRGEKGKEQPLRTALHGALPIRIFMMACHSQYLNATQPRGVYIMRFLNEFFYPEMETIETILAIFE